MHTDPKDPHGRDLYAIAEYLGFDKGTFILSQKKVSPEHLALMYNMADCTVNISDAEGLINPNGPTDDTGWLCNNYDDYLDIIEEIVVNPTILMEKGLAAREYARKNFVPEKWIEEIIK